MQKRRSGKGVGGGDEETSERQAGSRGVGVVVSYKGGLTNSKEKMKNWARGKKPKDSNRKKKGRMISHVKGTRNLVSTKTRGQTRGLQKEKEDTSS